MSPPLMQQPPKRMDVMVKTPSKRHNQFPVVAVWPVAVWWCVALWLCDGRVAVAVWWVAVRGLWLCGLWLCGGGCVTV